MIIKTDDVPTFSAESRAITTNLPSTRYGATLLNLGMLVFLLSHFGRYVSLGSNDLIQHFSLIDEIMKQGAIRLPPAPSLGLMAYYPPVAHWMAAIVGWIGGSGLAGMILITITSLYLSYLLIAYLVDFSSLARVLLCALAFYALSFTDSQIGWEVVGNFFYPQLVASTAYFAVLAWVSRTGQEWKQALIFALVGTLTMWIQPLIAFHILAAGIVFISFRLVEMKASTGSFDRRLAILLLAMGVLSGVVVMLHPAFKFMRMLAGHDGALEFGYRYITGVALLCGAIGVFNLWRCLKGRASPVDAILGSAVFAAVGLEIAQSAMLGLFGTGSAYAVKKHMFLIVTLGMINAVRIVETYLPERVRHVFLNPQFVAPVMSGLALFVILQNYATPLAPIVNALSYANNAVVSQHPDFVPGNTVDDDASQPLLAKVMVNLTAFKHPDEHRGLWYGGESMLEGATYAMVLRTPDISKQCARRFAEGEFYVIVDASCLIKYEVNTPLSMSSGGNGLRYLRNGWSHPEPWGTWSLPGSGGDLVFSIVPDSHGPYRIVVDGMAFITKGHPKQIINVKVNGSIVAVWNFDASSPSGERTAEVPESLIRNDSVRIAFEAPDAVSPSQMGESIDPRVLGLGVRTITLKDLR